MTPTPHPLTNFEIQEYYQNEPRFNGVFSRDNLPNNNNNNNNIKDMHGTFATRFPRFLAAFVPFGTFATM